MQSRQCGAHSGSPQKFFIGILDHQNIFTWNNKTRKFWISRSTLYLTQSEEVCWATSHLLFSDILQPQWQPLHKHRSPWIGRSFASEPDPSGARVSPLIYVLYFLKSVHCIVLFPGLCYNIIGKACRWHWNTLYTTEEDWAFQGWGFLGEEYSTYTLIEIYVQHTYHVNFCGS